jgi:hypothetical protein
VTPREDFWTDETLVVLLHRIAKARGALSNADREAIRQAATRLNELRQADPSAADASASPEPHREEPPDDH